ncbi:hypothetical protein [Aidingimonas halophila]|uniref:PD-(D/E)XK nuclease superfamily protein n=1 Tax=Aidingimonas halophila TaxID=574349 RepID=A0A1H3HTV8_9GAMM|nr:hypothetical protein [Aidingimonas halophila]GHC39031.1 hypothetical protein GCM10008094_35650 [Aidingimonas halophila]SDY18927.1 hypothetical protein SAMN05443545_11319 [Aidingimonas halophila]
MNNEATATLREHAPGEMVIEAFRKLMKIDSYLLEVDANERSISHRLGLHLQSFFPDWDVDCEYNRDGVEPKRIGYLDLHPDGAEDTEARTVFPDIIVHKRDSQTNYLVIEIKKSSSIVDRAIDYQKLRGYKRDLGYQYALFFEVGVREKSGLAVVEWV